MAKGRVQTPPFDALVDTGADYCLFPSEAAALIGIGPVESECAERIYGIGEGEVTAYFHDVSIVLGGHGVPCRVGFVKDARQPPLLGREGFLNEFAVTFDAARNEIVFKSR